LFFHKLSAFLDYSNHKQFFLYKAFASITSAPPLEKSWLRPCQAPSTNAKSPIEKFLATVLILLLIHLLSTSSPIVPK